MKFFIAKLVFQIVCGDGNHAAQFDEQLRLVNACSAAEAFEKAADIGHREEEVFLNEKDELVRWQFVNIAELNPLQHLTDGAELYSRITEADDAVAYCTFVNRRAEALREKHASTAEINLHH